MYRGHVEMLDHADLYAQLHEYNRFQGRLKAKYFTAMRH